jgi:hypothetical protein
MGALASKVAATAASKAGGLAGKVAGGKGMFDPRKLARGNGLRNLMRRGGTVEGGTFGRASGAGPPTRNNRNRGNGKISSLNRRISYLERIVQRLKNNKNRNNQRSRLGGNSAAFAAYNANLSTRRANESRQRRLQAERNFHQVTGTNFNNNVIKNEEWFRRKHPK